MSEEKEDEIFCDFEAKRNALRVSFDPQYSISDTQHIGDEMIQKCRSDVMDLK